VVLAAEQVLGADLVLDRNQQGAVGPSQRCGARQEVLVGGRSADPRRRVLEHPNDAHEVEAFLVFEASE
jgi:hypothetical protein